MQMDIYTARRVLAIMDAVELAALAASVGILTFGLSCALFGLLGQ
jgi:hypothetical protein